jgi:hypothetical protein
VLKGSWGEIPEVKLLPGGTYRLRCRNVSFQAPKSEDGNPSVMFVYVPQETMDDVDQEALSELGPDYDIEENQLFERIWLERGADWDRLRKHLLKHGITEADLEEAGDIESSLKLAKGRDVLGLVIQRQYKDKTGTMRQENGVSTYVSLDE